MSRESLESAMLELYKAWSFQVTTSNHVYVIKGANIGELKKDLILRGFNSVKIEEKPRHWFGL
jgi:hypothetical protein